jgi:hypothetical protein
MYKMRKIKNGAEGDTLLIGVGSKAESHQNVQF